VKSFSSRSNYDNARSTNKQEGGEKRAVVVARRVHGEEGNVVSSASYSHRLTGCDVVPVVGMAA
jgi:hypothetical protein